MSLHSRYTSRDATPDTASGTSTSDNTSGAVSYYVLVLIIVLPVALCSCFFRIGLRKWRRDGYIFRAPKKTGRKAEVSESTSALTGPVELSSAGLHETGELMGMERVGELPGGKDSDKVELMAVERPRELLGSDRLDDGSQNISTGERERRRISMEISAC